MKNIFTLRIFKILQTKISDYESEVFILKKITAILLSIIMLFTVLPLTVFAETDTDYIECTSAKKHHTFSGNAKLDSNGNRLLLCETCGQYSTAKTGDYYMYGSYPQSEVTDTELKAKLSEEAGDTAKWISYEYYSGSGTFDDGKMTAGDYMKYIDVTYEGETYRGVYFTEYRPSRTGLTSSTTFQDKNGYSTSTQYWFRYDPIKWRVLDPSTGLVMAETILDSQAYNNYCLWDSNEYYGDASKTYYANNWENSSIRVWLKGNFLKTAFSTEEQNNIKEIRHTTPAYSASYSKYDCSFTDDKVFLLSYTDIQNTVYGFVSGTDRSDTRTAQGSSYAKSQGLFVYSGNSWWWVRSGGSTSVTTCGVVDNGRVFNAMFDPYDASIGVRPAMYLQIPYEISITYKLDDGRFVDDYTEPTSYLSNETFTPPAADKMVKVGYTFAGWTLTTDMNTAKEYTANWTANTYNISYELNGGTNATANPATYTYGVGVAELLSPTRDGYTFAGWTLDGNIVTDISETQVGNITLSAQWEEIPVEPDDSDDSSGGVRMFYWLKWLLEFLNKLMTKMFNILGWAC